MFGLGRFVDNGFFFKIKNQKHKAINHEDTKGEEGKVKIYVSNKHYCFSFRLCSLMHFGVYLQRISP